MTIKELYQENRKIKVHANRYWSSDDVRSMCIRHDFYTCGDLSERCRHTDSDEGGIRS